MVVKVRERISDKLYQTLYQKGYRAGKREEADKGQRRYDFMRAQLMNDRDFWLFRSVELGNENRLVLFCSVITGELLVIGAYLLGRWLGTL